MVRMTDGAGRKADRGAGGEASEISRQAAHLSLWLASHAPAAAGRPEKVRTLRKALAAEGLAILPDPLSRFPCPKVVRVERALDDIRARDAAFPRSSSLPWRTLREGAPVEPSEHVRGGHRRTVGNR